MGIQDFFQHRNTVRKDNTSPSKGLPEEGGMDDIYSQKLTRSKKTLKVEKTPQVSPIKQTPGRKSNAIIIDDDDDDDNKVSKKVPPPKKMKIEEKVTTPVKMSDSSIHIINEEPASPRSSPSKSSNKKSTYHDYLARKSAGPKAPHSKEIPEGAPNCLEGLTFVFTGELESLGREEAQDLVKRYGGRVTTAPSGKTSFVVVGENAGASKLEKIEKLGLKTLSEDDLLGMISQSRIGLDNSKDKTLQTLEKLEKLDVPVTHHQVKPQKIADISTNNNSTFELWTDRYAPQSEEDLIGNHSNYQKIVDWIKGWSSDQNEKAILISGPPGIGKTTAAHLACKQAGVNVVEMNASDTRSKSSLHEHVKDMIDNRSLAGFSDFFDRNKKAKSPEHKYKDQVLLMDEVDGMSSGDRGGMAELIQLIKRTKIPIICVCNDRSSPKVRSLANYCLDLRFRRPDARMISPRIMAIAKKEGLELGINTIEELVTSTQGDIRQILNLLSTYRLTSTSMNFDQSKSLGGENKKDIDQGPFDVVPTLLGSGFDRLSLSEKMDLYFIDSSLVPLMIQENYIKSKANSGRKIGNKVGGHSFIELVSAAADSISDADYVDSLIRGANQEWSLAPFHAVMSTIRPSYFTHGSLGGRVDFASWLGQNSKQSKNWRLLGDITKHIFLHSVTNKHEVRLAYSSILAEALLNPLLKSGTEGVEKTINLMESYSLCREDFDSILDLALNSKINSDAYSKSVPSSTKTAFTRRYNQGTHILPYAVGGSVSSIKKISASEVPINEGDDVEMTQDNEGEEKQSDSEDSDISKDKMIKSKSTGTSNTGNKRGTSSSSSRGRGSSKRGK